MMTALSCDSLTPTGIPPYPLSASFATEPVARSQRQDVFFASA